MPTRKTMLSIFLEKSENAYDVSIKAGIMLMNRFCIDEEAGFELSGIYRLGCRHLLSLKKPFVADCFCDQCFPPPTTANKNDPENGLRKLMLELRKISQILSNSSQDNECLKVNQSWQRNQEQINKERKGNGFSIFYTTIFYKTLF